MHYKSKKNLSAALVIFCGALYVKSNAIAISVEDVFSEKQSEKCPAAESSLPIYNTCSNEEACGKVRVGTNSIRINTGWGRDQCGFKVIGWTLHWCQTHGYPQAISASNPGSASRLVDFGKRQCRHDIDCVLPVMGAASCENQVCGIKEPSKVLRYQSCRHFDHGIDANEFAKRWNNADKDERSALKIVLLLDENRQVLGEKVAFTIMEWIKKIEVNDPQHEEKFDKLVEKLELSPISLTVQEIHLILGGQ